MESIPKEYVRSYLLAWMNYCGGKFTQFSEIYERTLVWTKRLYGLGYSHIPISIFADLGHLLLLGPKYPFLSLMEFENEPEEKKLRLKYQGGFLSQIWQNAEFQKISELIQFVPYKDELIIRSLEILLFDTRDQFQLPYILNPIDLRNQQKGINPNPKDELIRVQEFLGDKKFFLKQLERFLADFNMKKSLFLEEELYELEHFDVFDKPQIRVLGRQIKKLERFIAPWDAKVHKRREAEEIETEHTDEGYYPTGGLSELTTKGSLENLVYSELVYIEDKEEIDLFDVRYFEQELLYYMRDSGQLRRKRRCLNIILEQDVAFDVTYPNHKYKLSNLLTAFILRIIDDLQKIFESENFIIKIFIDETKCEITENLKLLKLFLKEEISQNLVLFPQEKEGKRSKKFTVANLLDPKRKIHTLFLSSEPVTKALVEQAKELSLFSIQVGDFQKKSTKTEHKIDINREVLPQLTLLRDQLVSEMVNT